MSSTNRDKAIKKTLQWEGGYTNDPRDPGGATNWGITIADAKRYWKSDATPSDVKAMPQSVAIDIYKDKYWKTSFYDCDNLPTGVDLAVFDFGVNSGPSRAKKALDLAAGLDPKSAVNRIMDYRNSFLHGLSTFDTFGAGWMNRTRDIRNTALVMAGQAPTAAPAGGAIAAGGAVAAGVAAHQSGLSPITIAILVCTALLVGLGVYFYKKGKEANASMVQG